MGEIKQTNFRLDEESVASFRSFCDQYGYNQAQGFDHLLQVLELDNAKKALPTREIEIIDFETHVKALMQAFLHSLNLCDNTEVRVREEFANQLETKDRTISDYHVQIENLKRKIEDITAQNAALQNVNSENFDLKYKLQDKNQEIDTMQKDHKRQLDDKDSIIRMLNDKLFVAEAKTEGYDALAEERDVLQELNKELEKAKDETIKEYELKAERATRAAEKAQDEAVRSVRAEADEMIGALRKELQEAQIDAERQLRAVEKSSAEEIRKLEIEKAALREELATLKAASMKME